MRELDSGGREKERKIGAFRIHMLQDILHVRYGGHKTYVYVRDRLTPYTGHPVAIITRSCKKKKKHEMCKYCTYTAVF